MGSFADSKSVSPCFVFVQLGIRTHKRIGSQSARFADKQSIGTATICDGRLKLRGPPTPENIPKLYLSIV
jgi:hypothetical protein